VGLAESAATHLGDVRGGRWFRGSAANRTGGVYSVESVACPFGISIDSYLFSSIWLACLKPRSASSA
jgi:hypothetical protein